MSLRMVSLRMMSLRMVSPVPKTIPTPNFAILKSFEVTSRKMMPHHWPRAAFGMDSDGLRLTVLPRSKDHGNEAELEA
jgi:hypothetical protein